VQVARKNLLKGQPRETTHDKCVPTPGSVRDPWKKEDIQIKKT
jgi:hypothetical protein